MTVAEAAGRLGCATSTVRALVDSGDLTGHRAGRIPGGTLEIRRPIPDAAPEMTATLRPHALALAGACAAIAFADVVALAQSDQVRPPRLNGPYNVFVDFSRQTFNGAPTPMEAKTFVVEFATHCDANGCVVRMDNSGDSARNPGAPAAFEYRWINGRWETRGPYPYLCERMNPNSAVRSVRADYLIPRPDGSFSGERTLTVEGAGCPGEGPGVHRLPISVTPAVPPAR